MISGRRNNLCVLSSSLKLIQAQCVQQLLTDAQRLDEGIRQQGPTNKVDHLEAPPICPMLNDEAIIDQMAQAEHRR